MLVIRLHLREEGVERVISLPDGGVARHHPVRLDPVFEAVELPAGVAHLHPGLADVHRDNLPHPERFDSLVNFGCCVLFKEGLGTFYI